MQYCLDRRGIQGLLDDKAALETVNRNNGTALICAAFNGHSWHSCCLAFGRPPLRQRLKAIPHCYWRRSVVMRMRMTRLLKVKASVETASYKGNTAFFLVA